jgi:hypothetical protein
VTHLPLRRVEPDGTRVYAGYHKYKPMPDEQRTNKIRKPDDPRAFRVGRLWFLPVTDILLPDEQRVMPPHEVTHESSTRPLKGRCQ